MNRAAVMALVHGAIIVIGVSAVCLLAIYLSVVVKAFGLPRQPVLRAGVIAQPGPWVDDRRTDVCDGFPGTCERDRIVPEVFLR